MTPAQNERQTMEHIIRHTDWQSPDDFTKRYAFFVLTSGGFPSGMQVVRNATTAKILTQKMVADEHNSVLGVNVLLAVGQAITFHRWDRTVNVVEQFTWTGESLKAKQYSLADWMARNP